jgi:hypothetical protein
MEHLKTDAVEKKRGQSLTALHNWWIRIESNRINHLNNSKMIYSKTFTFPVTRPERPTTDRRTRWVEKKTNKTTYIRKSLWIKTWHLKNICKNKHNRKKVEKEENKRHRFKTSLFWPLRIKLWFHHSIKNFMVVYLTYQWWHSDARRKKKRRVKFYIHCFSFNSQHFIDGK